LRTGLSGLSSPIRLIIDNISSKMDYEELYAILPKSHWLWTVQDTNEWLSYIGLNSLQPKFGRDLSI
jgi:hypothetical protein